MAARKVEQLPPQPQDQSPAGCLVRLVWMLIGNLVLVVLVFVIYESAGWTIADLAYWLVIGLMIGARHIDIVRFAGTTINDEPATKAHFRRYSLLVLLIGAAVFAVARALGPGFHHP